jgi:hypothetical protein
MKRVCDMSSERQGELVSAFGQEAAGEMLKFGITRISVDHFHYKDFRYTNVKDAIAQAKREEKRKPAAQLAKQ